MCEVMVCLHNINIVAELVMSSALPGTQHFRPVNSRLQLDRIDENYSKGNSGE